MVFASCSAGAAAAAIAQATAKPSPSVWRLMDRCSFRCLACTPAPQAAYSPRARSQTRKRAQGPTGQPVAKLTRPDDLL